MHATPEPAPAKGVNTGPDVRDPRVVAAIDRYWRANVLTMAGLLAVWAGVSLGCSILFADVLNQFRLFGTGFPLGFWFAQQGSIITFVLVILVYCVALNRLDRKHHEELERIARDDAGASATGTEGSQR